MKQPLKTIPHALASDAQSAKQQAAPWRVAIYNLGCRVNRYESDAVSMQLKEAGFEIVDFDASADLYIVNTCAVTAEAARKSGQFLRRAKKLNPQALVVAMGCLTALEGEHKNADLSIGNKGKSRLAAQLQELMASRQDAATQASSAVDAADNYHSDGLTPRRAAQVSKKDSQVPTQEGLILPEQNLEFLPEGKPDGQRFGSFEEYGAISEQSETRAFVKIQDGCNQFCAYCTIPLARGRVCSREAEEIVKEVRALVATGYREVTLTGIHVCSYGADFGRDSLALMDLCDELAKIDGLERIRFGSVEPLSISPAFVERFAKNPKLCRHLHLSLQSGAEETLRRMKRSYTAVEFREVVDNLRHAMPEIGLTTDLIVGFPGETEEQHRESLAFCESIGFSHIHIFRYSPRPLTAAATYLQQVPGPVSERRAAEAQALAEQSRAQVFARFIGTEQKVLLEQQEGQAWTGYSDNYLPVEVEADSAKEGEIVKVKIVAKSSDRLIARKMD